MASPLTKQQVEILTTIEIHGSISIPVVEMSDSSLDMINQLKHTHAVWLPGAAVNFIVAKLGPNHKAGPDCTVQGLGEHNRYNPNRTHITRTP